MADITWLQWGRGLSTAEIRSYRWRSRSARAGFNGAAVFQPRKFIRATKSGEGHRASMGPRSFNRGNKAAAIGKTAEQVALQWGRGLSTAEILSTSSRITNPLRRFNGAAVFQPRKFARMVLR